MAKRDPKRSEIRLALESILDREYDIPVVPALKELDGMEARVAELEAKLTAIAAWLETNQPDVFKRGLWEAIIHTPNN